MTVTLVSGGTTDLRARKEMTTYTEPVSGGLLYITALRGSQGIVGISSAFVPTRPTPSPLNLALTTAVNADGSAVPTGGAIAAGTAQFTLNNVAGVSTTLDGHVAANQAFTDVAGWVFQVPGDYTAGTDITVTANANYSITAGAGAGTSTLAIAAYKVASSGVHGGNMIATAPIAIGISPASKVFTIVGVTLSPGSLVMLSASLLVTETANLGGTVTGHLNSIQIAYS